MNKTIIKVATAIPELPKKTKVAAYARVSSGKDAMLHSLSAQVSYYSEYIQNRPDWEYVGVYADSAITGTKDERPEFQRLLDDCRNGNIDIVITKSISRFARNTVTLLSVIRELKTHNVDVYFERENIHTNSGDGEFILTILASFAQEESLSASENCKWRVRRMFEEGRTNNGTMLGYRLIDGTLCIVPKEAKIVHMIFNDYLSGIGRTAIANKLNSLKLKTRFGGDWTECSVDKILRNEKYTGDMLLQKTYRADHLTKQKVMNNGGLPKYHVENAHVPIISRDDFKAVQAEIIRRADKANVPKGSFSVFTSKIRCGICGKNYRRKTTKYNIIWSCITYNTKGKRYCASKQIPETTLFTVSAGVVGLNELDETMFTEQISHITAQPNNILEFHFIDGHIKTVRWLDRSRSDSWTDEMREQARQVRLNHGGNYNGKINNSNNSE